MPDQDEKICFVIAPIGEEGSEIRRRSDQVLTHIITPAAKECGYRAVRADTISKPGMITSQVIQHLVEDPLVIADLTGRNPNVFYELAVRHAVRKPCVQIIQIGDQIPFDVSQSRTIQVDHHDLDSVAHCKEELVRQIHSVEKDPSDIDTPITVAIDLQSLRQSENPLEKSSAEIITMLQELSSKFGDFSETMIRQLDMRPRISERLSDDLLITSERLYNLIQLLENTDNIDEIKNYSEKLRHLQRILMNELGIILSPAKGRVFKRAQ
jgi:hypothetical protein